MLICSGVMVDFWEAIACHLNGKHELYFARVLVSMTTDSFDGARGKWLRFSRPFELDYGSSFPSGCVSLQLRCTATDVVHWNTVGLHFRLDAWVCVSVFPPIPNFVSCCN